MNDIISIRSETEADRDAVKKVNDAAFANNAEAKLVDTLRTGGYIVSSLVAETNGSVIGHILFSRLTLKTSAEPISAVSLAPMAVLPEYQRQGIGSLLVKHGLNECRDAGHRIVVVLGHPEFYPRFGFSTQLAEQLESPFGGGPAWMALELTPDALAGVHGTVEYAPPFTSFE